MPTIPIYYYFEQRGLSGIIRISSDWREEKTGFQNEHINEKIACIDNGKFYIIHSHLKSKTMGGESFNIVGRDKVSEDDYREYYEKYGGEIDTKEYRELRGEIRNIEGEIEELRPSCPKCNSEMTERKSKFGWFWGCSAYPKCDGTRKRGDEIKRRDALYKKLKALNHELFNMERKKG